MMKRNVVLNTAVMSALMLMAGVAHAQSAIVTAAPAYAVEVFKGTAPATSVALGAVAITAGVAIPAASTVTVKLQLSAGSTFDTGAVLTPTPAAGVAPAQQYVVTYLNSAGAALVATAGTTASNADVALISISNTSAAVGLGATLLSEAGIKIHTAGLATAGSATMTAAIYTGALTALPAAGTVALDAASGATTVASSATGITLAAAAATAGAQKIDLTANPVASKLNVAPLTVAQLGTVTATNGTAVNSAGAAYVIGVGVAPAKQLTVTIAAPAGFFAAMGTTQKAWLDSAACSTAVAGTVLGGSPSTLFATAAAASAATSVTLTTTTAPVTATAYNVCMGVDGTTAMIPGTATVALSLGAAAAQDAAQTLAATALTALNYNGAQIDVRNYVPAAVVGWTQYLRFINTGSVAASVSAQVINESTGLPVGTAVALPVAPGGVAGNLAAGAAISLSSTQIEAVIGAQAAATRHRIRITAPTNGLNVQSFLFTPNGSFTEASGAQ